MHFNEGSIAIKFVYVINYAYYNLFYEDINICWILEGIIKKIGRNNSIKSQEDGYIFN